MGAALAISLAGLVLGAPLAQAKAFKTDACMSHCSLERRDDGSVEALCSCLEKKFPNHAENFFALRERAPGRYAQELAARLHGATALESALVEGNECQAQVTAYRSRPRPANEFLHLAGLAQRPLCECVRSRVHFPIRRSCEVTKAGVVLCRFELVREESARSGVLRDATLHDYQSCIADRINYRKPASCTAVVCRDQPHACPAGKELVNVADTEGCCPIFECRAGGSS